MPSVFFCSIWWLLLFAVSLLIIAPLALICISIDPAYHRPTAALVGDVHIAFCFMVVGCGWSWTSMSFLVICECGDETVNPLQARTSTLAITTITNKQVGKMEMEWTQKTHHLQFNSRTVSCKKFEKFMIACMRCLMLISWSCLYVCLFAFLVFLLFMGGNLYCEGASADGTIVSAILQRLCDKVCCSPLITWNFWK